MGIAWGSKIRILKYDSDFDYISHIVLPRFLWHFPQSLNSFDNELLEKEYLAGV